MNRNGLSGDCETAGEADIALQREGVGSAAHVDGNVHHARSGAQADEAAAVEFILVVAGVLPQGDAVVGHVSHDREGVAGDGGGGQGVVGSGEGKRHGTFGLPALREAPFAGGEEASHDVAERARPARFLQPEDVALLMEDDREQVDPAGGKVVRGVRGGVDEPAPTCGVVVDRDDGALGGSEVVSSEIGDPVGHPGEGGALIRIKAARIPNLRRAPGQRIDEARGFIVAHRVVRGEEIVHDLGVDPFLERG